MAGTTARQIIGALGTGLAAALLAASCSSGSGDATAADADRASPTDPVAADGAEDADDGEPDDDPVGEAAAGEPPHLDADVSACPDRFRDAPPLDGEHTGFASAGQERAFHLLLPDGASAPRPLFVALTGTVQEELAFLAQSRLDELPERGWIVVAPVRNSNGLLWPPWDAMRAPAQADLPNPDAAFIEELVHCLAAHHPVDSTRVFVGGISIGGTMTTLLLRQDSGLFAGGIVGSGNFILTAPPEPAPLGEVVVIVAWGGETDRWIGCPDGRMGPEVAGEPGCVDVDFVGDAAAASAFYDAEPAVRQVACSADVGHIWIADATAYMADVLHDHPKGSAGEVQLPPDPPDNLTCTTEAFVR